MKSFDDIIASVSDRDMTAVYDGISMDNWTRARPDLDNRLMSADEQRFNLAFYARAAYEHVGWEGFSAENKAGFAREIERLYDAVSEPRRQGEFMAEAAEKTAHFIEDRHFTLATGSRHFSGGEKAEAPSVGKNVAYRKDLGDTLRVIGEEWRTGWNGERYPLWKIGTAKTAEGDDALVVSIPNLTDENDYESWKSFIDTFDKVYEEGRDKWEKGRIILDVRGNGGGEDKPIDHVAKRLYGNLLNTYKRCEIHDTAVSDAFLHRHGAYKPKNYERDGLTAESLVQRKYFSGQNKVLFDETGVYYPFNEQSGYHGRIDILLDKRVGSSAESAYTSFYHHPNVRYIGENTAGMQQYTQGSFAMPCGYLMRTGVTKLTYYDKEGENIEVKGHKPDVCCSGRDAFETALRLPRDEGRVAGFREKNEMPHGEMRFAAYDPKEASDPRKAYYARYLEPAIRQVEEENKKALVSERAAKVKNMLKKGRTEAAEENTATAGVSARGRDLPPGQAARLPFIRNGRNENGL